MLSKALTLKKGKLLLVKISACAITSHFHSFIPFRAILYRGPQITERRERLLKRRKSIILLLFFLIFSLYSFPVLGEEALRLDENRKIHFSDGTWIEIQPKTESATNIKRFAVDSATLWTLYVPFYIQDAGVYQEHLYLIGTSSKTSSQLVIGRVSLSSVEAVFSPFAQVTFLSPTRWEIRNGLLYFLGAEADQPEQIKWFLFDFTDTSPVLEGRQELPLPSSSQEPSLPVSSLSPSSSPPVFSSSPPSSFSSSSSHSTYMEKVSIGSTVSSLKSLSSSSSYQLFVLDRTGTIREKGTVETGWSVQFWNGSVLEKTIYLAVPGDLGGGSISADRQLYAQYILGLKTPGQLELLAADYNGDGNITVSDFVLYRKSYG